MLVFILACGDEIKNAYVEEAVLLEDQDGDGFFSDEDCDDSNASTYPQALEVCDGMDNNCNNQLDDDDGTLDTSTQSTFYLDGDIDGYGDINAPRVSIRNHLIICS